MRTSITPPLRFVGLVFVCLVSACTSRGHAQATLDEAHTMVQGGDYAAGIAAYRSLLARDASWQAAHGLAQALQATGQYQEAASMLRAHIADSITNARQLFTTLGETLRALGEHTQAEDAFQRAVTSGARDRLTARVSLAELRFERGGDERDVAMATFDEFIDIYNRGEARSSADLAAVARAVQYLGRRNPQLFRDALRAYDEAIAADSGNLDARVALGTLFLQKYNGADATHMFQSVLADNPNHPGARLGMALAKHFDGSSEAFGLTERSIEINPNFVAARAFLARLYIDLEDYPRAVAQAERALAVNPQAVDALAMLAAASLLVDDRAGFTRARDRALTTDPEGATFFIALAEVCARNRLYRRAVDFANHAVERDSLAWRGLAVRGLNRLRVAEMAEGRRDLERAFAGDPYDVWTKNTLDLLDVVDGYRTTRSDRFEFVLDPKEADLIALYLEPLAEAAYDSLSAHYGFRPPTPIRVEVYPRHADFSVRTMGLVGLGALGVSFGQVVAMDAPSARPPGQFHWGSTLWHELAHTFHMERSRYRVPRWFTEGLAVFEERRARPGWGDEVTPSFLVAFRQGRLAPVSDLNQGFMRPAYPEQVIFSYYQASLVFEMIEAEQGWDAILRMLDAYRDGASTPQVFRTILDIEPTDLDRRFNRYLERRFAAGLAALRHGNGAADGGGGGGAAPPSPEALARRARADTTDFLVQLGYGRWLFGQGQYQEALPPLERARELFPEYVGPDSPSWYLGRIYQAEGRLDLAARELAGLTARNAKHLPALRSLVEVEEARGPGQDPSVARALEALMHVYPYDIGLHEKLAGVYRTLGEGERAIRERRAVLALEPVDRAGALYQLARELQLGGRPAAARRAVLEALETAPNYQDALDLLVELQAGRGPGES